MGQKNATSKTLSFYQCTELPHQREQRVYQYTELILDMKHIELMLKRIAYLSAHRICSILNRLQHASVGGRSAAVLALPALFKLKRDNHTLDLNVREPSRAIKKMPPHGTRCPPQHVQVQMAPRYSFCHWLPTWNVFPSSQHTDSSANQNSCSDGVQWHLGANELKKKKRYDIQGVSLVVNREIHT